ncbi:TPA: hypothetical protein ACKP8A_000271 [Stenotrophomonas maltophilia]
MNSAAPTIGFDRYVQLEWLAIALRVRSGLSTEGELLESLSAAGLGKEAAVKTRTKLNALCLHSRAELDEFIDRGVETIGAPVERHVLSTFAWGAAVATYPFFGKVAELTGRLTALQGDCSTAEIHRRMGEVYGDREVTKRATQATIQTQANWGAVQRVEKGKRVIRLPQASVDSNALTAWLIEAAVRYAGKPVAVASLQSLPVLFPFNLTRPLAYVVSNSPNLELRSEGPSNQVVALRVTI